MEVDKPSCRYLMNVLNEVLHGFKVNFETDLEITQLEVISCFQRLRAINEAHPAGSTRISVADEDLLLKCSNLCLLRIDSDEFDTRLGETADVAHQINRLLLESVRNNAELYWRGA